MKRMMTAALALVLAGCSGGGDGGAGDKGDSAGAASSAAAALPPACDILREADAGAALGGEARFEKLTQITNDYVSVDMCNAIVGDADKVLTINVRTDTNPEPRRSGAEQAQEVLSALEIEGEPVDLGEHAVWVPSVGQLNVWYREGRVYLVIGGDADKEAIVAFGERVLAAYP